ncbi:hypothetical protein [Streptococcus dentiloxodontae]
MNRKDWLAYFETINGRKPSPAEFKTALDRGEFVLDRKMEPTSQAAANRSTLQPQAENLKQSPAQTQSQAASSMPQGAKPVISESQAVHPSNRSAQPQTQTPPQQFGQTAVFHSTKQAQPFPMNQTVQTQATKDAQKAVEKRQAQELKKKAKEEKARLKAERAMQSAQAKAQRAAEKAKAKEAKEKAKAQKAAQAAERKSQEKLLQKPSNQEFSATPFDPRGNATPQPQTQQSVQLTQPQSSVQSTQSQPSSAPVQSQSNFKESMAPEPSAQSTSQQAFRPVTPAVRQSFQSSDIPVDEKSESALNEQNQSVQSEQVGFEKAAIPVFSNRPSNSELNVMAAASQTQIQSQPNKIQSKAAVKAQKEAAKAEKAAAKAQAKKDKQKVKAALKVKKTEKSAKAKKSKKGLMFSLLAAIILIIGASTAGVYAWWRYDSGNIEGTWQLVSYQSLDEDSGKMTDALAAYKEKNQVYMALLAVKNKKVSNYSYYYEKGNSGEPSLSANNYLGSYQEIDQWNKAFTYTQNSSKMEKKLTKVVKSIYPYADQEMINSYIKNNSDRYKDYKDEKTKKTYTVNGDKLTVSSYDAKGKLIEKEVYKKLSSSNAKQAKSDYDDAKSAFEKNNNLNLNS